MNKPKKPSKKIEIESSINFYFDHISKKVSLDFFNDTIKKIVPKGSYDITIGLEEEPEYCYCEDYTCCGHGSTTNLVIYWKQKVDNKQYDKDMVKYQKKLAKWKKFTEWKSAI